MPLETSRAIKRIVRHFKGTGRHIAVETKIVSLRFNAVGSPDSVYQWHMWVDNPNRRAVFTQLSQNLDRSSVVGVLTDERPTSWDESSSVLLKSTAEIIAFLDARESKKDEVGDE